MLTHDAVSSVNIPDSVAGIEEHAFHNADFTEITIGDGAQYIGSSSFAGTYTLESLTIPENVNFIGNSAFGAGAEYYDTYIYNPDCTKEANAIV